MSYITFHGIGTVGPADIVGTQTVFDVLMRSHGEMQDTLSDQTTRLHQREHWHAHKDSQMEEQITALREENIRLREANASLEASRDEALAKAEWETAKTSIMSFMAFITPETRLSWLAQAGRAAGILQW